MKNLFKGKRRIRHFLQWFSFIFGGIYVLLLLLLHGKLDRTFTNRNGGSTTQIATHSSVSHLLNYPQSNHELYQNHNHHHHYHYQVDPNHQSFNETFFLWEQANVNLPTWMKNYFVWHNQQRELLNSNPKKEWNKKKIRYYLIECTHRYAHCGGTADRLSPLPFHVKMAAKSKRLLLIHWTRPAALEEFLLPPMGGVDWRVPLWLWNKLDREPAYRVGTTERAIQKFINYQQAIVVRVKFQSHTHGQETYDRLQLEEEKEEEFTYQQVYHDLFRVFFTPVPTIASLIEKQMKELNLVPGTFNSVHLRALYGVEQRQESVIQWWTRNSINCVISKLPIQHNTILFVSDSTLATKTASFYAEELGGIRVVHRNHLHPPLHLEKEINERNRLPSDYYDTFVDAYMIAMSQCMVYNMGGFGKWGKAIGYNSSCVYTMTANMEQCDLQPLPKYDSSQPNQPLPETLFLPSMPSNMDTNNLYRNNTDGSSLWRSLTDSSNIPQWMIDYFDWHQQTRQELLTPDRWKSMRLLILECGERHPVCGGTADRLKPLPAVIRSAFWSKRFLLIRWSRPCKLEEFLLPPKGGIDWHVPDWLDPLLDEYSADTAKGVDTKPLTESTIQSVSVRYQSYDAGEGWYNSNMTDQGRETPFKDIYHIVWKLFFTPTPPIAIAVQDFMESYGLIPGQYASAHVRALYAVDSKPSAMIRRWTINGLNCASTMRPGKPIFMASDCEQATVFAKEYAKDRNASILTHPNSPNPPLHLDKSFNPDTYHPPSDYYDTFIELYIMAFGQCVFISKGGYGHWANLIGGNTTCVWRQKRTNKGIQNPCNWTDLSMEWKPEPNPKVTMSPLFLEPIKH